MNSSSWNHLINSIVKQLRYSCKEQQMLDILNLRKKNHN